MILGGRSTDPAPSRKSDLAEQNASILYALNSWDALAGASRAWPQATKDHIMATRQTLAELANERGLFP